MQLATTIIGVVTSPARRGAQEVHDGLAQMAATSAASTRGHGDRLTSNMAVPQMGVAQLALGLA